MFDIEVGIMKVLYLQLGDQPGTRQAFLDLGMQMLAFDFTTSASSIGVEKTNQEFLGHVRNFKPDWIHAQLQMTDVISDASIIEARNICPGVVITDWSGDIRSNLPLQLIQKSRVVDRVLVSNVGQLELYKKAGCNNVTYWQIGYDPQVMYPKFESNFLYDVVFTANHYNQFPDSTLRKNIALMLCEKYGARAGVFGSGHGRNIRSIGLNEVNDVNNKSICVLSVSNFNDVSHYFSDRLLHSLASGRPTIIYRFPGVESYFADRGDCFIAYSPEDIINIIDFCKANIDRANSVGRNGYLKVLAEHTFKSRIVELVHLLGITNKL